MVSWLLPNLLWISLLIINYHIQFILWLDYSNLNFWFHIFLIPASSLIQFFFIIYCFRRDKPIIYTQAHAYPHKHIAPFLSSALSFHPTPYLFNRYLETIIPGFIDVPLPFETTQEIINVKSKNKHFHLDGQVSITWSPLKPQHIEYPQLYPILIIVPGLTGDIDAKYCRRMMLTAYQNGWQAVIFNPRGRGGVKFKSPQAYSVGYTEDLRQVIAYIHEKYPKRMLFAVGYSLGANYLGKLMGEDGENVLLSGAVCCACPTDPILCNAAMRKRPFVSKALAWLVKEIMLKDEVLSLFEQRKELQCDKAVKCDTLRQFDHYVIAPQFGYKCASEYYRKSSAGYTMMDIAKPTLFLYAKNDITVPIDVFCPEDYDGNPFICAVITRYGSHSMSWLQGVFGWRSWQTEITMEYLRGVFVLKCTEDFEKMKNDKSNEIE